MKTILRSIIGGIFIVSGGVKAIDPVGFSFKLEEYFSPSVFNLPWLESFALPIAIFIVVFEVILGAMLLLNIATKKVLAGLIALCVFFAFLTFYSAYYNKVTDCGCFGDAVKFTPWQSFYKDIALLVGLIALWLYNRKNYRENSTFFAKILFIFFVFSTAWVLYRGITDEPIIDFRDYKIGTNLVEEKKKIAENPDEYRNIYVLKNKRSGEEKTVAQEEYLATQSYWQDGTPWEILSEKTYSEKIREGYASEIKKFKIEDLAGNDITEEILSAPTAVLLFSYDPNALSSEKKKEAQQAVKNHTFAVGISTMPDVFPELRQAMMDATAIKTIARSNPFILVLKHGKIVEKKKL